VVLYNQRAEVTEC